LRQPGASAKSFANSSDAPKILSWRNQGDDSSHLPKLLTFQSSN
jgi:hypothetical protein